MDVKANYRLELGEVQEVRWVMGGTEPADSKRLLV
jgi:hypothetical protein